jgi:hypothetical protein
MNTCGFISAGKSLISSSVMLYSFIQIKGFNMFQISALPSVVMILPGDPFVKIKNIGNVSHHTIN